MKDFISNLIGNDLISAIIMSLVPLIELKGGIVFARGAGFSFFEAFGLCFAGSTLVFFPIFFLLRPILNLLKRNRAFAGFSLRVESYFTGKADKVAEKQKAEFCAESGKKRLDRGTFYKCVGVFVFVAIPLPMTGVWTGTAIAVFLGLKFKEAILPVVIGNAVAGLIISVITELCIRFWTVSAIDYLLWGLFVLAVIALAVAVIKMIKSKPKKQAEENDSDKGEK